MVGVKDFDKLSNSLKKFALKRDILDMKKDIEDLATKESIDIINYNISQMKKNSTEFIDKDECISRINTINNIVNNKLEQRITIEKMD